MYVLKALFYLLGMLGLWVFVVYFMNKLEFYIKEYIQMNESDNKKVVRYKDEDL